MIHRIHGRSLTDALERARSEHGADAVVVSQETLRTGEVTIAVSARRPAAPPPPDRRHDPGLTDLRERLARHGASPALIDHALRAVQASGVRGAYVLDAAARALGRAFAAQPSPKRDGRTRILALVGPSGAGKTTTIAKLGRRLIEGGRGVLFTSLDGLGVTALEHRVHAGASRAEADADRHEIPIHALASTAEIDEEKALELGLDVILLDTPGVAVRDAGGIAALARELGRLGAHAAVEVHLVLPATHDGAALDVVLEAFAPILGTREAAAVVLTKLDETPRPAAALERCRRARLAISFLCDGADARAHLRRARAGHFADLLLRGRMAA